jgi:hypothetical protein
MTLYGNILSPKPARRKRELIKNYKKYVNAGLTTAKEMDRLVNSILFSEMTDKRTAKLFREDK